MKSYLIFMGMLFTQNLSLFAVTSERLEQLCMADETSACESLKQRCLKDNKEACFRFGMVVFKAGHSEDSLPPFQKACKLGSPEGCDAYSKIKKVVAIEKEQSRRRDDATQIERQHRQQKAVEGMANGLQSYGDTWSQQPKQPTQTNCKTVPRRLADGTIASWETVCE